MSIISPIRIYIVVRREAARNAFRREMKLVFCVASGAQRNNNARSLGDCHIMWRASSLAARE